MADLRKAGKGALSAIRAATKQTDEAMEAKRLAMEAANPPIKASEAYGQYEGSYLKPIFYDRMKVDLAKNKKGGPGFSGIQLVDPNYAAAKAAAGVTDQKMATRILNRNTAQVPQGATVIFTPSVGGLEQHKSNSTMFGQFADIFADQRKNMSKEAVQALSDRASNAVDNKGRLIFPNGIDLGSNRFRQKVTTYNQRALMSDIFAGRGVGGEKGRTVPVEELLQKNLDPNMAEAGTLDLGNRMFILDGKVIDAPELHTDYPKILTGEDLNINYSATPIDEVFKDFIVAKEIEKGRKITDMDYTKNDPTQLLSEKLLTELQKAGYKDGGPTRKGEGMRAEPMMKFKAFATPEDAKQFQDYAVNAMRMAEGGGIKKLVFRDAKPMRRGGVQKMAGGGALIVSPEEQMALPTESQKERADSIMQILANMAKDQASKEGSSLKKPRAATDLLNRGVIAPFAGIPVDMINMGLEGVDALRDLASGKRVDNRLASEQPFLGSEHLKKLMDQYGITSGEDRPMMETALSMASPTGVIKGGLGAARLAKQAPEALSTARGGLETMSADVQRPFRPATLTMEGVAPDLGQKGGDKFKDLVTNRMITGKDAPVSMGTMGGRKTQQTMGQGLYENFAGQMETNPMVGITIPRAGNLATNKRLIADIGTAGQELGQEMVAAHKFTPLLFKNPKDATAMMIGGTEPLTKGQIQQISGLLPGMIVSHSPKANGMFVAPFEGDALDYKKAMQAASEILGKEAKIQFGKADSQKDIMFRGDYKDMGARPPSAESTEMRNRLKKAEERIVRGPSVSQSGRQSQPATLTSTVR